MELTELLKGFQWWVTAIEIPIVSLLFMMIMRIKKESEFKIDKLRNLVEINYIQLKDGLSSYKLEVAKSYASINSLKEVEKRLVEHLLRIEEKVNRWKD